MKSDVDMDDFSDDDDKKTKQPAKNQKHNP